MSRRGRCGYGYGMGMRKVSLWLWNIVSDGDRCGGRMEV